MNFLLWQYVLNMSDYMSVNIQAKCINDKEIVKCMYIASCHILQKTSKF